MSEANQQGPLPARESVPARVTLPTGELPDPWTTPLDRLDVSDSRLYLQDAWRPYFARLRREDPLHYTPESPFGPYWSVTNQSDIATWKAPRGVLVVPDHRHRRQPEGQYIENFIAMDPPKHESAAQDRAGRGVAAQSGQSGAGDPRPRRRDSRRTAGRQRSVRLGGQGLDRAHHPDARDPVRLPVRRSPQAQLLVGPVHRLTGNHRHRRRLQPEAVQRRLERHGA